MAVALMQASPITGEKGAPEGGGRPGMWGFLGKGISNRWSAIRWPN